MMLDFNHTSALSRSVSDAINAPIDAAILSAAAAEPARAYLGASSIGHDCLRRVQWDWRRPQRPTEARTHRVFWRGHAFEKLVAEQFVRGGFDLRRGGPETGFIQAGGAFRGHCDGIFHGGPTIAGVGYPALWEMKALGEKSFKGIEKKGLKADKPQYAAQIALYQAYLGLADHPAIFTMLNVENGTLAHLLVPFDPQLAQEASDRAVTVLRADMAGETLPRMTDDPDHFQCRFCAHREPCWRA